MKVHLVVLYLFPIYTRGLIYFTIKLAHALASDLPLHLAVKIFLDRFNKETYSLAYFESNFMLFYQAFNYMCSIYIMR